jgi:hypothetical protein
MSSILVGLGAVVVGGLCMLSFMFAAGFVIARFIGRFATEARPVEDDGLQENSARKSR